VSGIDQVAEVLVGAKPGIDVQEVLIAVPVVRVEVGALLPHRPDPQRGHAKPLEVREPAANAVDRASLECLARSHPRRPIRRRMITRVIPVEHWTHPAGPVAETIGEKEIKDLVAPIDRTFVHRATGA
jgi:hypothetical protein